MVDSYGIKIPTLYSVHGIDVSRYQQKIDWRKVKEMKSDGIDLSFVYIKATEGLDSKDPNFDSNWKESKRNGLLRGAYHYFKPKKSGKAQAEFFLSSVSHQPGDLPPCIDVEEKGQMKLRPFQKNLSEFMRIVEMRTGVKPIIYTSSRFYQDFLKNGFGAYPCWIANYHQPKLLLGKEKWAMWQHSDAARVDGIKGRVDFNTFNGSLAQLKNLCIKEKMGIAAEGGSSTLRSASR
jgi:lysozyme